MRFRFPIKGLALAAVAVIAFTALSQDAFSAARRPTPPGSYLRYKVYTVDQLIEQVRSNPAVRDAYARTFHMPADEVLTYMRRNVVESYVPSTKPYTVYCISGSGRIYTVHQIFRAGTKVFALRNGQPVIKWVCGNPLMAKLPVVKTKTVKLPPKVITKVSPSVETLIPNQPAAMLIPSETVALLPTAPVITSEATGITTISSNVFPLWLPLLPLGFLHSNGSGGSTTGGTSTTGSATTSSTTGPTTTTTSTTGPTTTTSTTGPETTTSTTGPETTTSTTGPETTTTTSTTGPSSTSTSTTGTVVPEPSSSTSVGIGVLFPILLGFGLSFRTKRRQKAKARAESESS